MKKHYQSIIVIIFIFAVIGLTYYYTTQNQQDETSAVIEPQPTMVATDIISPIAPTAFDNSDLKIGGSSHTDAENVYSILYPNDYKTDTQNGGKETRFYKTGATQRGQTEMYDGVIIVLETIPLNGQSLEKWVDDKLKAATADGTSEIVQPKMPTTLNGYPGFIYTLRGLGESKYTVIQKDTNSNYAVSIVTLVNDPQNVGFQKEVDKTLSTLQILK